MSPRPSGLPSRPTPPAWSREPCQTSSPPRGLGSYCHPSAPRTATIGPNGLDVPTNNPFGVESNARTPQLNVLPNPLRVMGTQWSPSLEHQSSHPPQISRKLSSVPPSKIRFIAPVQWAESE